ncbi:hypothetical protein AS19_14050 [Alcanivorax sp. NBRC 101098]|nr:hypothetical protein AS19_14050 [Alcanivorax sp. NBRC 101098]
MALSPSGVAALSSPNIFAAKFMETGAADPGERAIPGINRTITGVTQVETR